MPIPGFIQALRAKIGTDFLQVPTAAVLARDEAGRLLLIQHHESRLWGLPGGIIEPHELPADAAVRETWEETGVLIELQGVVGVFAGEHFSVVYQNGDRLAVVQTVFSARVSAGTPRPDGTETSAARLVHPSDIPKLPLAEYARVIFDSVQDRSTNPYFTPATWRPPQA
jgi:8-oxo-dGTP pyrophosphatase MutT (NUDIX family)